MGNRTRLALAAGGTLAIAVGVLRGGLIVSPGTNQSSLQVNGYAYALSLLGFCLLVRAAGGHRTGVGLITALASILVLVSPFWSSEAHLLVVLPLAGAACGLVTLSAAAGRETEPATGREAGAHETAVKVGGVPDERLKVWLRRVLIALATSVCLAATATFFYLAHLLEQIPME